MIYLGQPHMILNHHISRKGKIETKNEADQAKLSLQKVDSSLGGGLGSVMLKDTDFRRMMAKSLIIL